MHLHWVVPSSRVHVIEGWRGWGRTRKLFLYAQAVPIADGSHINRGVSFSPSPPEVAHNTICAIKLIEKGDFHWQHLWLLCSGWLCLQQLCLWRSWRNHFVQLWHRNMGSQQEEGLVFPLFLWASIAAHSPPDRNSWTAVSDWQNNPNSWLNWYKSQCTHMRWPSHVTVVTVIGE